MTRHPSRGVTLVELMVTLAIVALLVLASVPSFTGAIVNSRIRANGESLMAGIQFAKSEAVSRNARVRFQLTSSLDSSCVVTATGTNWVVKLDPNANPTEVEGRCNAAPIVDDPNNPPVAPFILQTRPGASGPGAAQVAATQASLVFSGLGRLADVPAGNVVINLTNSSGGTCAEFGGDVTCLRIVVSPIGQARMCNPARTAGDPQAC